MPPRLVPCLAPLALALGCVAHTADPASVVDQTPAAAAELATEVVCEYVERCGQLSITCADCDGDDCGGCTVEVEPVAFDACAEEVTGALEIGFGCMTLDADEEAAVDACLQALGMWACPDVEAAQAWANGGEGDDPDALPAGCDVLEQIRHRCDEPGGDGSQMPQMSTGG